MIMNTTTAHAAILDVVRGNASWASLRGYGIDVRRIPGERRWEFGAYNGEPVLVSEADVVEGIKKQLANEDSIAEWAQFVLAASDLINLDELDDSRGGLLDCLWKISDGELDCALKFTGN